MLSRSNPGFGPVITPTVTTYVPWRRRRLGPAGRSRAGWAAAASADDGDQLAWLRPFTAAGRWCLGVAIALLGALALVLWSPDAHADDSEARTAASPYFQIKSGDPTLDAMPLKSTRVDVRINGVIADVRVTQQYRNEGARPIDAKYVFPGSTGAAVHAMNVRVGERLITATIREKRRAQIEFKQAQSEGKTAALLEQERPNVFSMNVANILPGDDIAVELRYTELLAPTEGRYSFVFPTVVGPRYHAADPKASTFPALPYLRQGVLARTNFDLTVQFVSPLPVSDITSSSHAIELANDGRHDAKVDLADAPGEVRDNRDFILSYRLAGERTATGLSLWQGGGSGDALSENYFLAVVEPPKRVETSQINPREYIFVVDISGSMHGYPLQTAKVLLRNLIGQLRPSDSFNVLLFSGSADMLHAEPVPASRANIERAIATIDRQRGGGSTEIVPALKRIAALPKPSDVSRSVIVVTDGYVMVEREVFELVRKNLGHSNVFAFGIGHSVNRHLIEGIARAGQGEAFVVTKPDQAAAQAERLRRMIDSPVLTSLRARFEGLDVYDVQPDIRKPDALPDVLGGRPVVIVGKYRASSSGAEPAQARLIVEGQSASGTYQDVVLASAPNADAGAIRHLWARQRIAALMDQEALEGSTAQKDDILQLGLTHSLLTPYTSFLAVDALVRNPNTPATPVQQALPLPLGVGESALMSATVPSTPEPHALAALAVVLGMAVLAWVRRRRSPAAWFTRRSLGA